MENGYHLNCLKVLFTIVSISRFPWRTKKFSLAFCDRWWKLDLLWQSQKEVMGRPRTTINITVKTEHPRSEGNILHLVIMYYGLLKPNETVTGDVYKRQVIKLNAELLRKKPVIASNIHLKKSSRKHWRNSN